MAVSVDTVYQRVLALANKEQRGYITPQEFNLFANQAQMDIFEQYFYDLNQFGKVPGNDTMHADMVDILEEKISIFEVTAGLTGPIGGSNVGNLNTLDRFYRLSNVRRNNLILESVSRKDFRMFPNSPLVAPTTTRPIYMVDTVNNTIQVAGRTFGNLDIDYIQSPAEVNWDYVVVNDKALYNATSSTDFELHLSEASELVYRILAFAGISIEKPNLAQMAASLEQTKVQQEKQ
jgi:hypothetical protein|tara:strand:+ start:125 stop:826 length:702 start_codon:yes stop_codon:yes gene_type:complete